MQMRLGRHWRNLPHARPIKGSVHDNRKQLVLEFSARIHHTLHGGLGAR